MQPLNEYRLMVLKTQSLPKNTFSVKYGSIIDTIAFYLHILTNCRNIDVKLNLFKPGKVI